LRSQISLQLPVIYNAVWWVWGNYTYPRLFIAGRRGWIYFSWRRKIM